MKVQRDPPLVFISGASSGIGQALAHTYFDQGYRLALCSRTIPMSTHWPESLCGTSALQIYHADVCDASAMREVALQCLHQQGLPDIVIANAGISIGVDLQHAEDLAVAQQVMNTNVLGVLHTLQPFLNPMRSRGSGHLVAIASVAGIRGLAGQGAYCASKSAVITFMESLWSELRSSGIKVTTINPGWVATPLTANNRYPMPFLLAPQVFAELAVRAIAQAPRLRTIPWQMGIASWFLRHMPATWLAAATANRPRKARQSCDQE